MTFVARPSQCFRRPATQSSRWPPSSLEVAPDCTAAALVAGGVSVHFLQKRAHGIELRAEAFPISGLQSLHCLIVAIKRLPCLTCRRACDGHLLRRARNCRRSARRYEQG